jgi:hypothetical protein
MPTAKKSAVALSATERRIAMDTAPALRPEPGETHRVKVLGGRINKGGDYGAYPVLLVQKEDGTIAAFHAFHEVAQTKLAELAPKGGDDIVIHYAGYVETNASKKDASLADKDRTYYHSYSIFADDGTDGTEDGELDWTSFTAK